MLLALLRLVGGLVGGALGGLPAPAGSLTPLWFDAERAIMGGTARLSEDAGLFSPAPGGGAVDGGLDRFGGGADADADVEAGGGGVEVGPARGGGGVEGGGGGLRVLVHEQEVREPEGEAVHQGRGLGVEGARQVERRFHRVPAGGAAGASTWA